MAQFFPTASETIIRNINARYPNIVVRKVYVKDDINGMGQVMVLELNNNNMAAELSRISGNATYKNNLVFWGYNKATYMFSPNVLNIPTFGKTNPKPIFNALKYETYKNTGNVGNNMPNSCLALYPPGTICFYNVGEPYYEFTNFHKANITINGVSYMTTEHYFQIQKLTDAGTRFGPPVSSNANNQIIINKIMHEPQMKKVFALGRSGQLRNDWELGIIPYKIEVMKLALNAKFTQHNNLKLLLLSTRDALIVEHTVNDNYWGDGGDGTGQNILGKLLMEVRNELIVKKQPIVQQPIVISDELKNNLISINNIINRRNNLIDLFDLVN